MGAAAAGGLLFLVAAWLLVVSPQRSKAGELTRRSVQRRHSSCSVVSRFSTLR